MSRVESPAPVRFADHLLRVSVPFVSGQTARERANAPIADRLACTVAALFGVPWPDNPAGRTWAKVYDEVSLKQIGLGTSGKSGAAVDDIAPSTLNRFRPDRKAGTVLTGANRLFASLIPAYNEVLVTIASTEDNRPLATEVRLAIWATLVQETYKSQPALFAAAITARRIQQALSPGWNLVNARDATSRDSGAPRNASIPLLDDTILDFARQSPGRSGDEANSRFLAEDLVERWTKHLLSSSDSVVAWIDSDKEGRVETDAFVASLNALNSFLDEFSVPSSVDARPVPELLLPRIPAVGEALRLSKQGRRASVLCIMQVHRLLRDNPRYDDEATRFQTRVTDEARRLAELATQILDPSDPLIILTRARWLNKHVVDTRERDWTVARPAILELRESIDLLHDACTAGRLSRGSFVDEVRSFSVLFGSVRGDALRLGDDELAAKLGVGLARDWASFFALVGISPEALLGAAPHRPAWSRNLDGHLHGYADLLVGSDSHAEQLAGIDLLERVVIPARRQWDPLSLTRSPLRISLQLLIRALDRQLAEAEDGPQAGRFARSAVDATLELLGIPEVQRLLTRVGSTRVRSGEVNTLTALVIGATIAAERAVVTDELVALDPSGLIAIALAELSGRAMNGESGRLVQAGDLRRRVAQKAIEG